MHRNALDSLGPAGTLRNLPKLKDLRVDKNQLSSLGPDLCSCTALRRLDLSHNKLSSLEGISGIQKLEELKIANNSISTLKHLRGLPALLELDISYNRLKTLDGLEFIPTLASLRVEHNHLTTLKIPPSYTQQLNISTSAVGASGSNKLSGQLGDNASVSSSASARSSKASIVGMATIHSKNTNSNSVAKAQRSGKGMTAMSSETAPTVGLVNLVDVYVTGNRLVSVAGIETLCPNAKYVDLRSNNLTAHALLSETATVAAGSTADLHSTTGLQILSDLKKLTTLLVDMNPVARDASAMQTLVNTLRTSCKHLSAIDGMSFTSQSQSQHLFGTERDQDMLTKSHNKGPFITGIDAGPSISEALPEVDVTDDALDAFNSAKETEAERQERKERQLREQRDPASHLRPKIVPKVVTMEQIVEAEENIRHTISDSKLILKSIFLLDDTPDGLFASVKSEDLPLGVEQMQKILAISLPPPPSKAPEPAAPMAMQSPRSAMREAVKLARERTNRIAQALGQPVEAEELEPEDPQLLGLGKPGYHRRFVVDMNDSVQYQQNVTVIKPMLELGPQDTTTTSAAQNTIIVADVKGESKGASNAADADVSEMDPRSPNYKKGKLTNKDKIKDLVKSIRDQVEAEFLSLPTSERKEKDKNRVTGGTIGVTTRPAHEADLPLGSGLTRYGSKIKDSKRNSSETYTGGSTGSKLDPYASTSSIHSTTEGNDVDDYENPIATSLLNDNDPVGLKASPITSKALTHIDSTAGINSTSSPSNPSKYDLAQYLAKEAEKKALDTERAVWSYSRTTDAHPYATPQQLVVQVDTAGKPLYNSSSPITAKPVHSDHGDRNKLQEVVDRRLGFSLTDPKSPVPGSRSSKMLRSVQTGHDTSSALVSTGESMPRQSSFARFQITGPSSRPTSRPSSAQSSGFSNDSEEAADYNRHLAFSQTFDPRFHKNGFGNLQTEKFGSATDLQDFGDSAGWNAADTEGDIPNNYLDDSGEELDGFQNSALLSGHAGSALSNAALRQISGNHHFDKPFDVETEATLAGRPICQRSRVDESNNALGDLLSHRQTLAMNDDDDDISAQVSQHSIEDAFHHPGSAERSRLMQPRANAAAVPKININVHLNASSSSDSGLPSALSNSQQPQLQKPNSAAQAAILAAIQAATSVNVLPRGASTAATSIIAAAPVTLIPKFRPPVVRVVPQTSQALQWDSLRVSPEAAAAAAVLEAKVLGLTSGSLMTDKPLASPRPAVE